jgi:hypothetical protein
VKRKPAVHAYDHAIHIAQMSEIFEEREVPFGGGDDATRRGEMEGRQPSVFMQGGRQRGKEREGERGGGGHQW